MSRRTGAQRAREIQIRPAVAADREEILAMYKDFEPKNLPGGIAPSGQWLDELATFPNFLALAKDRIVGHGFLRPEGEKGEVAVFVHQNYRRKGIGRRLLEALAEEARHQHLRRIWGITEADNTAMLSLARSLGFVQQGDSQMFWLRLEPPEESQLVVTSPPQPQD